MLGKLQPDFFPNVFGPGQDEPLDADAVRAKFAAMAAEVRSSGEAILVANRTDLTAMDGASAFRDRATLTPDRRNRTARW